MISINDAALICHGIDHELTSDQVDRMIRGYRVSGWTCEKHTRGGVTNITFTACLALTPEKITRNQFLLQSHADIAKVHQPIVSERNTTFLATLAVGVKK